MFFGDASENVGIRGMIYQGKAFWERRLAELAELLNRFGQSGPGISTGRPINITPKKF